MATGLLYEEPSIVAILVLASFLLLLNIVNYALDNLIYCGLLGQILVGVAWTQAGLLEEASETLMVQLGYLGLILLVYEGKRGFLFFDTTHLLTLARGGLSTSFSSVKAYLALSTGVALTGIGLPIALSYVLRQLAGASPLQAFSAGAALSSTSLGTTFTILGTCDLTTTRLGTVITTAAMLDDIVGLIMVQVMSNLGTSAKSLNTITIVRPVVVSIGLVIILLLACRFLVLRFTIWLDKQRKSFPRSFLQRVFTCSGTAFLIHTAILVGLVTVATYAGTSNLFAAYLAGASISWWDSEVPNKCAERCGSTATPAPEKGRSIPHVQQTPITVSNETSTKDVQPPRSGMINEQSAEIFRQAREAGANQITQPNAIGLGGTYIYQNYYGAAAETILKPFFFVSEDHLQSPGRLKTKV